MKDSTQTKPETGQTLAPTGGYASICKCNGVGWHSLECPLATKRKEPRYSFGGIEGNDIKIVASKTLEWAIQDNRLKELQELIDEIKAQITEKYTPRISDYDSEA